MSDDIAVLAVRILEQLGVSERDILVVRDIDTGKERYLPLRPTFQRAQEIANAQSSQDDE